MTFLFCLLDAYGGNFICLYRHVVFCILSSVCAADFARPLLACLRTKTESAAGDGADEASYEWVYYDLDSICSGRGSVAVRQRAGGKVTLNDMRESFATKVDNTGNVCLWPAEEVMAHYILSRATEFSGKHICELGAGVGLCGLAMACALDASSLLLTDGNKQVVETLDKALKVLVQLVASHTSSIH